MKKTFKGFLALAFCVATIFATMVFASAVSAPKAKVKTVTYNTVTISWAEIKDADGGYEIQRSTNSKKGWKTIATAKKGATSYKDSKLTTGTTYYYRVRSIDKTLFGKKYSDYSSTVKAKPVPAKVTGLKSSVTHNSVKLTWSKVSGASGYEVQVYSSKKWKSYKTTSKNTLTISKLKLGTTYQYRVRAYKTVSKKKIYGDVSSSIKATPALKAPSSLVLKGVTSSTLTLSWSAVDGAKGYEVYNANTKKWTDTKTKRTLTVKKLKAGTKYSFLVRAYSGKVDGAKTKTLSFYTSPSAPTGLKLKKATTTSLELTWSKATGASGYQVQYSTDKKKWTNLSGASKTTNTIKSLSSGKTYYVRVRAYVKNSNVKDISATSYGSYSSILTAYTNVTAPKTVTLKSATTSSLTFSWSTSTGASSYEYYNPVSKKWVSTGTGTSATIKSLSAGKKYTVKVRATGKSKTAAESSSYSFITAPAAPSNLKNPTRVYNGMTVTDSTTNSIKISWSAVTGAAMYQIQYSTDNKKWTSASETTSTTTTIKNLKANTTYYIRVRAYVKNPGAKTYGAYTTITAKTSVAVTTTSYNNSTIRVSWNAASNAKGYVVERYNGASNEWLVYDFSKINSPWSSYDEIDTISQITTTETSLLDSGSQRRTELYRVYVVNANGHLCPSTDAVMGQTADINVTVGDYATEVEFAGDSGATKISVTLLSPGVSNRTHTISSSDYQYSNGKYKVKLALAPNSYYFFSLGAEGINKVSYITVKTKPLSKIVTNTSDANYNASVSSQLLYLAQAINNTKAYTDKITAKLTSTTKTKCGDIEVYQNGNRNGALEFLFKLLAGDELATDMNDSQTYSYTFTNGKYTDSNKITTTLKSFIEPNTTSYKDAYVHNGISPSAWKTGFSSFSSSLSNGKLTVSFKIKKETNTPIYHNGFLSVLNSSALNTKDFSTESVVVGESSISATIATDCILETYNATAPFTGKFAMSMLADKDVSQGGASVNKGDELMVKIPISGSSGFKYTFTR